MNSVRLMNSSGSYIALLMQDEWEQLISDLGCMQTCSEIPVYPRKDREVKNCIQVVLML